MASLKLATRLELNVANDYFHGRKIMASLKLDGVGKWGTGLSDFHGRKIMASLKPVVDRGYGNGYEISMVERSWPH